MTSKVDETISKIPMLKVDLGKVFNFEAKCIDELAASIIKESLDYALETSVRRLESVGKINPLITKAAMEDVLPAVKTLADLISRAPRCKTTVLDNAPIKKTPSPGKAPDKPAATKPKTEKTPDKPVVKTVEPTPVKVPNLAKPEVSLGKQVTIKYDGEKASFWLMDEKAFLSQIEQPQPTDVTVMPETTKLAKIIMGKRLGDKVKVTLDGKEYNAEITEVKERKQA